MRLTPKVKEILSWYEAENPGVKTNLAQLLMHGRLAGSGKLVILPVDQGFEHGPARSFAPNPAAYDPRYHFELAIEAGLSAFAAPLGLLAAGADRYAGEIPLILKGIATAEDVAIALDHGVDWIYVSNHGGRQLDHGRGAMHVLPDIVDAAKGRAKIMVDGGFCRGSDVVKAIALGADMVGIGRLQCWALAAAGETGVLRMLELLEDEVIRTLGLLGVTSFAELNKSYLHPATATNAPSVFSAFPLFDIEPYRY